MAIELPAVIARYFAEDAKEGPEHVAQCFTDTAVVTDEGRSHEGRSAIAEWKASASTQYSYTVEPFAIVGDGDRLVVTSRVAGNFPGSPVDLRYIFKVEGEHIAALEIAP
jgi:hypothetical protein